MLCPRYRFLPVLCPCYRFQQLLSARRIDRSRIKYLQEKHSIDITFVRVNRLYLQLLGDEGKGNIKLFRLALRKLLATPTGDAGGVGRSDILDWPAICACGEDCDRCKVRVESTTV